MHPFEVLAKKYPLIVRTQYHAQIAVAEGGYHDIWMGQNGLKLKLHGQRNPVSTNVNRAMDKLDKWTYKNTDLSNLRALENILHKVHGKLGIYVDAGYKDGKAKLCVINMRTPTTWEVHVDEITVDTSQAAELAAINMAANLWPEGTIHTDCQALEGGRVKWIPRESNREADQFSNLRK